MDKESDWDDLPLWLGDFVDKNQLTDFVCNYLKKPVRYSTFKDWTFEELRAIKFRTTISNRSKVLDPQFEEHDLLPYDEEKPNPAETRKPDLPEKPVSNNDRRRLEVLIRKGCTGCGSPDLPDGFMEKWKDEDVRKVLSSMDRVRSTDGSA